MLLVEVLEGAQVVAADAVGQRLVAQLDVAEQRDGGRRVAQELLVLLLLRRLWRRRAATAAHAVVIGATRRRLEATAVKHTRHAMNGR